jgi:hypothetical protein
MKNIAGFNARFSVDTTPAIAAFTTYTPLVTDIDYLLKAKQKISVQ